MRSLDAEADRLWHANKKLRLRVHQLEEHTKHVEHKLDVLKTSDKLQNVINLETIKAFDKLQNRTKVLEDLAEKKGWVKKKETKKK